MSYTSDTRLLFTTRLIRMFAYGFLSVILALYLASIGLSEERIGLLFSFTLLGDVLVSLIITLVADRVGRRWMLMLGAGLMVASGIVFALTSNYVLLVIAGTIGVIAPSDKDIGPFLSIEQASLAHLTTDSKRTGVFAWYNLTGSFASATGSLLCGAAIGFMQSRVPTHLDPYRVVIILYALAGVILGTAFRFLSPAVEVKTNPAEEKQRKFALQESRGIVLKLSSLFAVDAFAGGFTVQSMLALWFHLKFGVTPATLGGIFFGANIFAGISALSAARLARRFGLINTMVFTHIPSSILLILVPLMPNLRLAIVVFLLRFTISQMDVPTRQSYTMAVVKPEERSAASGVTNVVRSVGASISPALCGRLLASPTLMSVPFFLAGGLKILYDLVLYRSFQKIKPPEEVS